MIQALILAFALLPHGGGLDSLGCHHDRKRGGYHEEKPLRRQVERLTSHGACLKALGRGCFLLQRTAIGPHPFLILRFHIDKFHAATQPKPGPTDDRLNF